ncbi:MAG TPA: PAS domain S-box protein [Longimicrobiales bacterium]
MAAHSPHLPADIDVGDLLDLTLECAPTPTLVLDSAGRVLCFNRACEELTGLSEAEVHGRALWELLVPAPGAMDVRRAFASLGPGRLRATSHGRGTTRDGESYTLLWTLHAAIDHAGAVRHVVGTGVDLTRQLKARVAAEALRVSEMKYSGIVSIAADAIISVDDAQRIVLFNDGAQEIFGWTASEVIGQRLDILIPERYRDVHRMVHVPAFAAGSGSARRMGERREIYGLRRSGEEFPAEASISKLTLGTEHLFTVVLRDVTARKRLEAAQQFLVSAGMILSSSLDYRSRLRELAALAVEGLADVCLVDVVGEDGGITRLEVACRDPRHRDTADRLLKLPIDRGREHLISTVLRSREALLVADVTPQLLDSLTQSAEHRAIVGELNPVSYMAVPLAARDQLHGVILLLSTTRRFDSHDFTLARELAARAVAAVDNARLYAAAQQAIRARDEIVSIVAHDLGNPLGAIRVGTSLLLRSAGLQQDEDGRGYLAGIRSCTDQMERLITNLLDLRRIEDGRLKLAKGSHSPARIVEDLEAEFRLTAGDRGVTFQTRCDSGTTLEGDRDRILQALENLIGNAFKFTPAGGSVTIAVQEAGGEIGIDVTDTGPGIAADQIPHLFERYWQGRDSGRRSMGLGLPIAKAIVDAHGGRIWAESEPGRGTTFHVRLPRAARTSTMAPLGS